MKHTFSAVSFSTLIPSLILFGWAFFPLAGPYALADDVRLSAAVDKQTVYQNEEVHFSVRVYDAKGNIPAPLLPNFIGFDTFYSGRASHFSFINGKSSSTTEFNYVLVPKATGVFKLEPVELEVDGKPYRTESVQIEVLGKPVAQALPPTQPFQAPGSQQPTSAVPLIPHAPSQQPAATQYSSTDYGADDNIFLRVNPSKRTVYSNEQLLLTYSLLTRYDTRYEGFETEPETSGFWVEEFPMERDIGRQTEIINRKKYMRADIKKLALFPTAPGEYVIKPGSIKASVQIEDRPSSFLDDFFNDSFFSSSGIFARRVEKTLSVPPITIVVKPLPEEGKPKSFNGAVGEFRMSSSFDKKEVKQNEPVTLQLVIEGEGNVETISYPALPELSDVKVYDADKKTEFFKAENLIAGKKAFEIIFIPKLSGTLQIPALEFSFFNPKTEKYVTLNTQTY